MFVAMRFAHGCMTPSSPTFDSTHFRSALAQFATGVTLVTARGLAGQPIGLTVSSFNSVSLDPPLILWSLSKTSSSLEALQRYPYFAVNVLSSSQHRLAIRFASKVEDRFDGTAWHNGPHDLPLIDQAAAHFVCRHYQQHEAGDHLIFIGEVLSCSHTNEAPLIFHAGGFALSPQASETA